MPGQYSRGYMIQLVCHTPDRGIEVLTRKPVRDVNLAMSATRTIAAHTRSLGLRGALVLEGLQVPGDLDENEGEIFVETWDLNEGFELLSCRVGGS